MDASVSATVVIRLGLLAVLIAVIVALSVVYARPLLGLPPATASPAPTAASPAPSTPAAATTAVARPSPTATPSPSPTPTRTPTASCPPVPSGGRTGGFHSLTDVRVAHQPGFDRVVFEFRSTQDEAPVFHIERASSPLMGVAGQPVPVQGAAIWSIRLEGATQADQNGRLVYQGSRDLDPATPLVKDLRLVEDFEAQMIWAIGLAQLECPRVMTLRSPVRVVLDFPAAP